MLALHLPAVQRLLSPQVQRWASALIGGELTFTALEYRLWTGHVRAEGVRLVRPGLETTCTAVDLRIRLLRGLTLRALEARVTVTPGTRGPADAASNQRPWTALDRFAEIEIVRGALRTTDGDGSTALQVEGIEIRAKRNRRVLAGTVVAKEIAISRSGQVWRATADARIDVNPADTTGTVHLRSARVRVGQSLAHLTGQLQQLDPLVGRAQVTVPGVSSLIRTFAPDLSLEGDLAAYVDVVADHSGHRATLRAVAEGVRVAQAGPLDGFIRAHLDGDVLRVDDIDLAAHGGSISGEGAVSLGEAAGDLQLRVRGLDLRNALAPHTDLDVPVSSHVDADLALRLPRADLGSIKAEGTVAFRPLSGPGLPLHGSVTLSVADGLVHVPSSILAVPEADLRVRGTVGFDGRVGLHYGLHLRDVHAASGMLAAAGVTVPRVAVRGALLAEGTVDGVLPEWTATASLAAHRFAIEEIDLDIESRLRLTPGRVDLVHLTAKGLDGTLTAGGSIPSPGTGSWNVSGRIEKVRLIDLLTRRGVPAGATSSGHFDITGESRDPELSVAIVADVPSPDPKIVSDDSLRAPAFVELSVRASRRGVLVDRFRAGTGEGSIDGVGRWTAGTGDIEGRMKADGLHLAAIPGVPRVPDLESVLAGELKVSGTLAAPKGGGHLSLTRTKWRQAALPDLRLDISADGRAVDLEGRAAQQLLLTGRMPLERPWPLHLEVDLAALPVAAIIRAFSTASERDASVTVSGRGRADIRFGSPSSVRYEAYVESAEGRLTQPWRTGPFSVHGTQQALTVRDLEVVFDAGRLRVDGQIGAGNDNSDPLVVVGTVPLSALAALTPLDEAEGEVVIDVAATGYIPRPSVTGTVQVAGGFIRQGPLRFDDLQLHAVVDGRGIVIREAGARIAGGHVRAAGGIAFHQDSLDKYHADLQMQQVDLARLIPAGQNEAGFTALLDVDVKVASGRLSLDAVRLDGTLTSAAVSAGSRTLGLETPVSMTMRSGALTHTPLRLVGPDGNITVETTAAVAGQGPFGVSVAGELDLAFVNPVLSGRARLDGLARVDARVERGAKGWRAFGDAELRNGRLALPDSSTVVSGVTAILRARDQRIDIVEASARVSDAEVALAGHVMLSSAGPVVELSLRADDVPLEYPAGLRTRSSADLRLTGGSRAYRLAGDIVAHTAIAEFEAAGAGLVLDRMNASLAAMQGRGSLRDRVELDLNIRLEDGLRVAASRADLVVEGALRVGGTMLAPVAGGSLTLREGGMVRVGRAEIQLQAGQVELSGDADRPPELDVTGRTLVSRVSIDLSLSGPLDDVRLGLSSSSRPDLSQADLATLIVTGRTTSAAASHSTAILTEELLAAAGRVIDRQVGGPVMIDVSRDESVSVDNADAAHRLNIGIPLRNGLYVTSSHSLARGSVRWLVDYQPGREVRVRMVSDDDGSEAVEVSQRFDFDAWSRSARPRVERARPRIGRVAFEGTSAEEETRLRARMNLEPDDEFDPFRSHDAARDAQKWLVGQGFLEATVDLHETSTASGVDLTVHVVRGPSVRIDWRGDDPGRSLRARVAAGWNSVLPRRERAMRLAREVRLALQAARHYAAGVIPDVIEEPDQVRVSFDVSRGPRGSGVDLQFEGNTALTDAMIATALPPRNSAAFFAMLEPEGSRRLEEPLRLAYATEGFLEMRAGTPRTSFDRESRQFSVTIPIVEGDRARVVALELPEQVRSSGSRSLALQLRTGEPFRFDHYALDRARLLAWFRYEGYPEARMTSVLEPQPHGLTVRFVADPGPRAHRGRVLTARDGRTRQRVLDEAVVTPPGGVIGAASLDESRERLIQTGVFRSVDLRLSPVDDRDVRDVVIDSVERSDVHVEYSLRYSTPGQGHVGGAPSESHAGIQAGAGFELVDPFGWADRYRFSGLLGQERRQLNFRYDAATFFQWRVPTEIHLFEDRKRVADAPGLGDRVAGAAFTQTKRWRSGLDGRRLHDRFLMQWGYAIRRVRYPDFAHGGSTVSGLRAGLIHSITGDTRDSLTDPRQGALWVVASELDLAGLGSDVNYVRAYGQLSLFIPLLPRLTWAQGYRIGVVPGDDPFLLIEDRFFAGGASSVRGLGEGSLGPRGPDGVPIGGQTSLIFNQELRFPVWRRLYMGVFYDAGNVFAVARELDLRALRQSAGVGLRLMFPFGPVRVDWGHVLDPRAGEKRARFSFSIGHAF